MPKYKITKATPDLISKIKKINETCLVETYSEQIYKTLIDSTYVCLADTEPIGYILMAEMEPQNIKAKKILAGRAVCIFSFAVLPEYRRKKIGTKLMSYICKYYKMPLFLHVRKSNIIAKKMYEKFGFIIVDEDMDYYKTPVENAYCMCKKK